MPNFYPTFNVALGNPRITSVYIKDNDDEWQEFIAYEYFRIVKRQNQVSEFEMKIFNIKAAEKLYVKEFAEIMFFSENTLVLKGRIQKVTYGTGYETTISGYGSEASLLDREFSKSGEKRVQYSSTSAASIAKQVLSKNADGVAPWLMEPATTGIFDVDYGTLSIRFEWANRLKALVNTAEAMDYEWWITQDEDFKDYFHIGELQPTNTKATVSQETFAITGASANATQTSKEKDISNMANKIDILGRGDGENQLMTSTYNASETHSLLSADITNDTTTISLADGSDFPTSGTMRIMEEQITYTGKDGNTFTGCTRGASSTTAYAHKKGVFVEKYVDIDSAEEGSSVGTNGILDFTLVFKDVIDRETLELIATRELLQRKDPIVRISVIPNEPIETARDREIGELVTLTDTESGLSDDYRIVGMTFKSDYGFLGIELECSNKSLSFIEQMQKLKEENENLQRYMQGATNIYWFGKEENIDMDHPLTVDIFIPDDAIAINKVIGRPYRIAFQGYSSEALNSYRIDSPPLDKETSSSLTGIGIIDAIDSSGTYINTVLSGTIHNYQSATKIIGGYFNNTTDGTVVDVHQSTATATSGGAATLTDSSQSWTVNTHANTLVNTYWENKLDGEINDSVETITVDDASAFPSTGTLTIESEEITYTGTTATEFTGCTRGANDTTAATHADEKEVYYIQNRIISSNTSDALTVSNNWTDNPTSDSKYYIYGGAKTLTTNSGWNYQHRTTDDLRGKTVTFYLIGEDNLGGSGNALDTGDNYSFGILYNLINLGIYNPDSEVAVEYNLMVDDTILDTEDTGTAEAGTSTTLQDTDKSWGVNDYAGYMVHITGGTGEEQTRTIASNTSDTLTVENSWETNPSSDSEYTIFNKQTSASVGHEATSDIELTDYFTARGWHTIKLLVSGGDKGEARFGLNGFVKCFIHSDDTSFPLQIDGGGVVIVTPNTLSSEGYRGSDCDGSDSDKNRTLTVPNTIADNGMLMLVVNGLNLHDDYDFTLSGDTITFLNPVWDTDYIKVLYIKDN